METKDYLKIEENSKRLNFLAEKWSKWLPEKAIKTVKKGGFYSISLSSIPSTKIIQLNTLIYSNDWLDGCMKLNSYSECEIQLIGDPFGQFAFFREELENARSSNLSFLFY